MNSDDTHSHELLRFQSDRLQRPGFFALWLLCFSACALIAFNTPAVGAALSLLFAGLALVEFSGPRVEVRLSASKLTIVDTATTVEIPLDSLESISDNKILDPVHIYVHHRQGSVAIPRRGSGELNAIIATLGRYENAGPSEAGSEIPAELQAFWSKGAKKYEDEKVVALAARSDFGIELSAVGTRRMLTLWAALGIWLIAGVLLSNDPLIATAITGAVFGVIMLFIRANLNKRLKKLWKGAGLVISPDGLALAQGDQLGVLLWSEVLSVKKQQNRRAFSGGLAESLVLQIKGAELNINNVYEANLEMIEKHINSNLHH